MTFRPVNPEISENGSSTAPFLQDAALDCDVSVAGKIYRLTQTYLFTQEPPLGIMERNLFTQPVLENAPEEVVDEIPKDTRKPKKRVRKKKQKPKTTIEYLEL